MRAILTALTAILLLLPCFAQAQSVLRIGLNDDPDVLDPTIRLLVSRIEGVAQHPEYLGLLYNGYIRREVALTERGVSERPIPVFGHQDGRRELPLHP